MPVAARIVLCLCGAAIALYAAASLTGDWLSTPPWWEQEVNTLRQLDLHDQASHKVAAQYPMPQDEGLGETPYARAVRDARRFAHTQAFEDLLSIERRRDGREAISISVGAVGLALAGFAIFGGRRSESR